MPDDFDIPDGFAGDGFRLTPLGPEHNDADYVSDKPNVDARVHSWVRATYDRMDQPLWQAVSGWLASSWPFAEVDYAPRSQT